MTRLFGLFLLALACWSPSGKAEAGCIIGGDILCATAAAGGYVGPGDVIGSASGYWSCTRAYTASYAAGAGNACDLVRASDSTSCTMVFQTNGNADVATTNSCTTGTQTVTQFCNATTCRVSQAYDQAGAHNLAQSTNGTRPTFDPAGAKVMVFAGAQGLTSAGGAISQVYSISAVAQRTSGTSNVCVFCTNTANVGILYSTAGNAAIFSSSIVTATAANNSCHVFEGVFNSTTGSLMVDGTPNTPLNSGGIAISANWGIGSGGTAASFFLTGTVREVILYSSNITSSQSALSTNQTNYGGC